MLNNRLFLTLRRKYSKNVISSPMEIQLPKATIDQYVMEKWNRWEDKIAIECGVSWKRMTYKELRNRSKSLGVALAQLGFKKKTALLAMPNCPEFPVALLGALQAGVTVSPANPLCRPNELKHMISDAGVRFVLTTQECLQKMQQAIEGLQIPIVCTGPTVHDVISFEQLSSIQDPYEELLPTREEKMDQLALLPYSCGSSHLKGVRLSHSNITANIHQTLHPRVNVLLETTDTHQDVVTGLLPFSHTYGITILLLRSLRMGAKILCFPKFHPKDILRHFHKNKNIVLEGNQALVNFLANDERVTPDLLSKVRVISCSTTPVDPEDLEKLEKKGRCSILQGYGMPEASLLTMPIIDSNDNLAIGPPLPGTFGKVVDPITGEDLAPEEMGELCFKGPQVMEGYHNNPKATSETLDSEGWLHTGDIGYADEEGNFFIVDRLKELVRVKGYQVQSVGDNLPEII